LQFSQPSRSRGQRLTRRIPEARQQARRRRQQDRKIKLQQSVGVGNAVAESVQAVETRGPEDVVNGKVVENGLDVVSVQAAGTREPAVVESVKAAGTREPAVVESVKAAENAPVVANAAGQCQPQSRHLQQLRRQHRSSKEIGVRELAADGADLIFISISSA
jgi:hypothetical protein